MSIFIWLLLAVVHLMLFVTVALDVAARGAISSCSWAFYVSPALLA
jgi:hypothetical protein